MLRRHLFVAAAAAALIAGSLPATAQAPAKVGLILPMTGPFASTGKQVEAAAKLYVAQHGAEVAGRKIELIVRDDTGAPDVTKRIAQEMVLNDQVQFLAGFGLTPLAFAAAPIATETKTPMIVMAAGTSVITDQSPFIARTSFTLPQVTIGIADWAAQTGGKKAITLVTDFAPGHDAEKSFKERFMKAGGQVAEELRVPIRNPDFAPFLQRVIDAKPDTLFVFVPSGVGAQFMKQFVERGLDKSGVRLVVTGDVTDDDILNEMGDAALGVVSTHHYSAAHNSPENKAFVEGMRKAANIRANFMGVGGWDGMHLIYESLRKTNGSKDGTALIEAMKGLKWTSPRGPIQIDAKTRDIIQNVYVRKVEKVGGELFNVEFSTFEQVPDPVKAAR
jgi:branched-chain amino acid transport system substrate-binding protein